jgi:hypothetical protein
MGCNAIFWVAKSWPFDVSNDNQFFTRITDAINAARMLGPDKLQANRPAIYVAPGVYSDEGVIDLLSNTGLFSWGTGRSTFVAGFRYTPATGINTNQAGNIEAVTVEGFSITSGMAPIGTISVDYTSKNNNLALAEFRRMFALSGTFTGNPNNTATQVNLIETLWSGQVTVSNMGFLRTTESTFNNGLEVGLLGGADGVALIDTTTVSGGNLVRREGSALLFAVRVAGNLVNERGFTSLRGSTVTGEIQSQSNISIVDARVSQWGSISGPGAVNRTVDSQPFSMSTVAIGNGMTNMPLAVPYTNANYSVNVVPANAAAVNTNPAVVNKAAGSVTFFGQNIPADSEYSVNIVQASPSQNEETEQLTEQALRRIDTLAKMLNR